MLAAGLVLAASLGAACGWLWHRSARVPTTALVAPDPRQSGIILPFTNSSGDPAQDGLAENITAQVTDHIARSGDMPAVPGVTAAAYRGKPVDLRQLGQQYGVHFALIGSARRKDGRLIVSATIYEIGSGLTVWGRQIERPDGPRSVTEIAQVIYESYWQASLDVEVAHALQEHPDHLDKRDLIMEVNSTNKRTFQESASLIERALALDPNDLMSLERQSRLHSERVLLGLSDDPETDLAVASQASDRMLEINPRAVMTLRARSKVLRAQGKWQEAEGVLRRVIALQPTEALRRFELGTVLMAEGRHAEALASFEDAKAFAGGNDPVPFFDAGIATAELAQGKLPEAVEAAHVSLGEFWPHGGRYEEMAWLTLIAAEADSGEDASAQADMREFLATPRSWHSMAEVAKWPASALNRNLLDGLRKAGFPTG